MRFNHTPRNSRLIFPLQLALNGITGAVKPIKKHPKAPISISPAELQVWMIGHATALINFYGTTILTDPVFVNWIPFPKRVVAPGYQAQELPRIDYVIVSHAHMDHCDRKSLRQVAPRSGTVITARNCRDLIEDLGFKKIIELDWGQKISLPDIDVTAYKPEHWGERWPWQRKNRGYNSFVIEREGQGIFFCGDSAYSDMFQTVGERHRIDLALLPIGSYFPHALRRVHMDPLDAMRAFRQIGAKYLVPVHWGNFRLSLEPINEPPMQLERLSELTGTQDNVYILNNGESITLPRHSAE